MRKFSTSTNPEEPPLAIVSTLAIISIMMHLMFPQHIAIVKANKDTKPDISQKNSLVFEGPIYISQEDRSKNKPPSKEGPKQKDKILAVQIENETNKTIEKNTENDKIKEVEKIKVKSKKMVLVTAYSSTVDQCDSTPFITANGTHVHDGTIAANFLKFGTKVKFPSLYGDKIFTVEDRMKSNYKVDIWFPTRQEAINFGAKRVEMEIL
ncbi:MAG: 3D domain-containing protein [Candidatus Pacebacteria bacterium]|nr:3D domain-containing protein [Candidatus Paceibacterota bacterium]